MTFGHSLESIVLRRWSIVGRRSKSTSGESSLPEVLVVITRFFSGRCLPFGRSADLDRFLIRCQYSCVL